MKFSKLMDHFGTGIFSVLAEMRKERLAQGKEVIDLSIGAPNIAPPAHVMKALSEAALKPENYLYAIRDTAELRKAASDWYQRRYGVTLDPETEIVALMGSQEGLSHFAMTVIDPGDTVLVPDPCYPVFQDGPVIAGADIYYMPQRAENNYVIDLKEIPEEVARRARLMVVSYPNNPTTAMAPDSFYEELIAFAKKYDIIVLHDNAYSELVFDGKTCGSFLQYPGAKEVGVEFNSLSKTYGFAGARVGFCLGNAEVVGKLAAFKSNVDYGIFLPVQAAAVAALTGDQSGIVTTRQAYETRRNLLCDGLTSIGWKVDRCPATMFVWAKIPDQFKDSNTFVKELFAHTGVLVTPGSAFGPSGEGYVRMALVQDAEAIERGIRAIDESGILK